MVRITNSLYHEAYEYIKADSALGGNCIIFVASDVDSICAVRIFQALLKSDIIPHKIVPVSGHKDLEEANEKLVSRDENLRSIVMINCGGGIMIGNLFTAPEETKVYIIDSHRPLLLDNLLEENNHICVFDDESDSTLISAAIDAFEKVMEAEDEDDEDDDIFSDEYEEDEDGRPINPRSRQRRRLNTGMMTQAERNERRQANRIVVDYYNQGAFFANSVSGLVYSLAQQLGKTNNDLLWLAIVGVTSQYLFERIDTYKYAGQLEIFKDDRARLNVDRNEDGGMQDNNNTFIKAEDEYRFMMFRHWSLYDSMYHSGYVSSKLGVWKDAGKKRLNNMFAKMGFSLQQCQQVYTHMDMDLKQMLRNKIEVVAPLYGLTDICFPSFTKSYGWECCLSASDVVYALSTILETSPAAAVRLGVTLNWNDSEDWQPTAEDASNTVELKCNRRNWWMRNFYTAYDALGGESPESILKGLKLCMKTQKAIVREGTYIIDKRMVKLLKTFRFVNIRNTAEQSIFQHPSTLTKLGLFLTDAYREHGKKNLPIVVSSFDEEYNTCLVVALSGAPTFGDVRKNTFGLIFEEAVETTKARVSFDSFDQTVIQVHGNDVEHFIESLYSKTR